MDLKNIREKLDKLDLKLVEIIAKRMALIPKVAEYKKIHNIQRYQPKREKEIIDSKRRLAENLKLNPDLVENLFKQLIKEAHRIEKEILKK
jgi:chorismate mutase-like protein